MLLCNNLKVKASGLAVDILRILMQDTRTETAQAALPRSPPLWYYGNGCASRCISSYILLPLFALEATEDVMT